MVNQRTACGCDELFGWSDLPDFATAAAVPLWASPKLAHLQQQLVTALHQHFRSRWPSSLPDWSPEEIKRGLDRPTGNRVMPGHGVDLSSIGVPYINASVVPPLVPSSFSYIATQHPLPHTIADFWRMILVVQPVAIVMLNGMPAIEDTKDLAQYWLPSSLPDNGLKLVAVEDERYDSVKDLTIRSLRSQLHDKQWSGQQLVVSWWQDQTDPPREKFLALHKVFNELVMRTGSHTAPVVVHCAGGIGRAGVFIAADNGARSAALGGDVTNCSPDRLVAHLRKCRQNMVQTAEQYEFLHTILPPLAAQLAADLAPSQHAGSPGSPSPPRH